MAWKQSYTTASGEKRYRVAWRPDPSNPKVVKSKSFLRSKDADAYMLELGRREQLGHLWQDEPTTFGEFAGIDVVDERVMLTGNGWFDRYQATVASSTYDRRVDVIRHLRELVPTPIDRITPAQVEELTLSVQRDHPRQAKFVHETIKMILRAAKVRGQAVNPALLELKPPSYEPHRRRQALGLDDIERLAEASSEPHLIRVAAYTGLRQGELLALRDEDVDLEAGKITVTGSAYKAVRHERTKTRSGTREVPIPPPVVQELRLQRLKRAAGTNVVFPTPTGKVWDANHLNARFREWREAAHLDITFHDLRHTFASLMVEVDAHPKVLQDLMGHKNFNVTMDLYTHLADSQKRAAVDALDGLIRRKGDDAEAEAEA